MRLALPLRPLLWLDAATGIAMAGLLLGLGAELSPLLGLPQSLLTEAGLILLPFVLLLAWTATRPSPQRLTALVVAINVGWVVASLLLLAGPWVSPTPLGTAFVLAQAGAVAVIAWLQHGAARALAAA